MSRGLRLLQPILLVAIVFVISRLLIRSLPGDPLETLIAESGTSIPRDRLAQELGLHLPFWSSLMTDIQSGLGRSLVTGDPVFKTLFARLCNTLVLSSTALALSLALAVFLSIRSNLSASDSVEPRIIGLIARLAILVPTSWIGPLLLYAFAILLPWTEFKGSFWLAAMTLGVPILGQWFRLLDLRIRQEAHEPPFRSALAKGVSFPRALLKHALAPAGGALLAILGTQWGSLLAGTFVVETIFDWPGLGTAWTQAVLQRDYPMVEGATFLGAATCLIGTALGDLLQNTWDPRLGYEDPSA